MHKMSITAIIFPSSNLFKCYRLIAKKTVAITTQLTIAVSQTNSKFEELFPCLAAKL